MGKMQSELCDRCVIRDVCDLPDGMRPQPPKCGGFVPKDGEEADGHERT